MSLSFSEIVKSNPVQITMSGRIVLQHDDFCRVPSQGWMLEVISGCAWVTYAGQDILLNNGDKLSSDTLPAKSQYQAVISALGSNPLIMEMRHS